MQNAGSTQSPIKILKQQLRNHREGMENHHATRLHRAISWLLVSEAYDEDDDISFITLWIAFNACYGIEGNNAELSERQSFRCFIEALIKLDTEQRIYHLLWENYSGFVRSIVNNQFMYAPFWVSHREGDENWISGFDYSKKQAMSALANQNIASLLVIVLDRLYVLRNQLVHGGATYQSRVNREQVKSARRLLFELMPVVVATMLANPETNWGDISYPVV